MGSVVRVLACPTGGREPRRQATLKKKEEIMDADGLTGQADMVLESSPPSATQAMFYSKRAGSSCSGPVLIVCDYPIHPKAFRTFVPLQLVACSTPNHGDDPKCLPHIFKPPLQYQHLGCGGGYALGVLLRLRVMAGKASFLICKLEGMMGSHATCLRHTPS